MLRTALRSLRAHRRRFLLSAVAVVLGVAFISGSLLYTGSFSAALAEAQSASQPGTSVAVQPDEDAERLDRKVPPLDDRLLAKLRTVPGAAAVRGTAEGAAFVVGRDGRLIGDRGSAKGANTVAGADSEDPRYPLADGRRPRSSGEIALDTRTAERAGVRPGDRVRIVVHGEVRTERLTGTVSAHDLALASGGTLTLFDSATARRRFGRTADAYTAVSLTARRGVSERRLAQQAEAVLPDGVRAVTRHELDREELSLPDSDQRHLSQLLLSFGAVALLVAAFLVANTFTALTAARAREHALLRVVGADRRYVLRLVLAEAALLGAVATVVGYPLGAGVAAVLNRLFGATALPAGTLRFFAPPPVAAAVAVGIGVTLVSAYVPARRAAAVPPVAALRTSAPPAPRALVRRNVAGIAVTALGAAGTATASGSDDFELATAAGAVLLLGLIVLTPLLVLGATALLRRPLVRLAGVHGQLAVENARRNPRRTAATSAMLMIGLALVSATTVGVTSAARQEAARAEHGMISDLRVEPVEFADIDRGTARRIARLPDAEAATPTATASVHLHGDRFLGATVVDPRAVARVARLTVHEGSLDRLDHGIAVTRSEARRLRLHLGSRISGTLQGTGARIRLPVVAIYDGPSALEPALLPAGALPARADRAEYGPSIQSVLVRARPGRTAALKDEIRGRLANPALLVRDRADAGAEAVRSLHPVLNISYAMLSVAVLIGVLGLVNTMVMAVSERVGEFGMLRAVGLDRGGVASVVRLESVVISLLGAVLGVAAGTAVGAAAVAGQGARISVPWGTLGVFLTVATVIGVLAAMWPGRQAARIPLLRALRTDTE